MKRPIKTPGTEELTAPTSPSPSTTNAEALWLAEHRKSSAERKFRLVEFARRRLAAHEALCAQRSGHPEASGEPLTIFFPPFDVFKKFFQG